MIADGKGRPLQGTAPDADPAAKPVNHVDEATTSVEPLPPARIARCTGCGINLPKFPGARLCRGCSGEEFPGGLGFALERTKVHPYEKPSRVCYYPGCEAKAWQRAGIVCWDHMGHLDDRPVSEWETTKVVAT